MNLLDIGLLVAIAAYGLSGFWQGFIAGLSATIGLLAGGAFGIFVVPGVLDQFADTLTTALLALFLVLACATVGQAAGSYVGARIRQSVTWRPARSLDALGGAVLSMAAVLAVAWALGYAVSGSRIPGLADAVRSSAVLDRVDRVMPDSADRTLNAFNRVVDANLFPRYLEPFTDERIAPAQPPNRQVLSSEGVQDARESVVKVIGQARCRRGIEGSGFVYAPGRIMTNAHVVAGVSNPFVIADGRRYQAEVVVFDDNHDIAVLAVSGLGVDALEFDRSGEAGDSAAILGYPENGPFDARPARIRMQQRLRSPDIYNEDVVVRQVYSLRGLVRPGNSGGPLIAPDGDVLGVIFAASVSDSRTGYALTAKQVAHDARKGRTSSAPVSSGSCA